MPAERATFDNDSDSAAVAVVGAVVGAAVGPVNWVDSFVDCRIVVDLWFSAHSACCMNGLHYSYLCCNSGS